MTVGYGTDSWCGLCLGGSVVITGGIVSDVSIISELGVGKFDSEVVIGVSTDGVLVGGIDVCGVGDVVSKFVGE